LTVIRRAIVSALSVAGLAALVAFAPVHPVGEAMAQSATAALVAKPVSLPDMALGPAKAPVTITEYAGVCCVGVADLGWRLQFATALPSFGGAAQY